MAMFIVKQKEVRKIDFLKMENRISFFESKIDLDSLKIGDSYFFSLLEFNLNDIRAFVTKWNKRQSKEFCRCLSYREGLYVEIFKCSSENKDARPLFYSGRIYDAKEKLI